MGEPEMMTPDWTSPDGTIRLWNRDWRDVLPTLEAEIVDAFVTDPPFNVTEINGRDGTTSGKVKRADGTYRENKKNFGDWDRGWTPEPLMDEAKRLLRHRGNLIAFTSDRLLSQYIAGPLKHMRTMVWKKTNPPGSLNANYVSAFEWIVWLSKGEPGIFNGSGYEMPWFEYPIVHATQRLHPHQKPIDLVLDVILRHTREHELVCDPFAGSGTTPICCVKSARRCVATENDPQSFNRMITRIEAELRQPRLFPAVAVKETQSELFTE